MTGQVIKQLYFCLSLQKRSLSCPWSTKQFTKPFILMNIIKNFVACRLLEYLPVLSIVQL